MTAFLYTLYICARLGGIKYLLVVMRHSIAIEMEGLCMMYWISELWCIISLAHQTQMPSKFQYTFLGNMPFMI